MPTFTAGTPPPAEIAVEVALVRRLLEEQHPNLKSLPLSRAAEGWDNVTFRLGNELAVRVPRRSGAARLVVNEQRWLPRIAGALSLPIPTPTHVGVPSPLFPWHWSVLPWIAGTSGLDTPLEAGEAPRLGRFLRELHAIDPMNGAPQNPHRGVPLGSRQAVTGARLERLLETVGHGSDLDGLAELLAVGSAIPIDVPRVWLHGDLHAKNVVSADGRLTGVIDWGDICTGDPATDLASVWNLFEPPAHARFWEAYGEVSEATRKRAAVWAATFGLMLWDSHHRADPAFAELGVRSLERVAATG